MKELDDLRKELKKIGGNILLASTPGYEGFFEEFAKDVWRINLVVDMESVPLEKFLDIKKIVKNIFSDYNLITSAARFGTVEYWFGQVGKKNLLLHIIPFSVYMNHKNSWEVTSLFNSEVVSGEDFTSGLVLQYYNWIDFFNILEYDYIPSFIYLKENVEESFRIGMLKSYFLKVVSGALYCKGVDPMNRKKIKYFFGEKFSDGKMLEIIDKFFDNKYTKIDVAVKDTLYFTNKLFYWKGLNLFG